MNDLEKRLQKCRDEKIHQLGLIQSHGIFIALDQENHLITHASESIRHYFPICAEKLLGNSIFDYFDSDYRSSLEKALEAKAYSFNNPLLLRFNVEENSLWCDCVAHTSGSRIILELEPKQEDEDIRSGVDQSFNLTAKTLLSIKSNSTVEFIANTMANDIKEFTGFDRVMVYRFDKNYNGQVIAEAAEPELTSYLGLHYPESDIPKQARELYEKNWLRLIRDVDDVASPIVSREREEKDLKIDLTYSTLRAVSPYHIQYLKNMGVCASMSISILTATGKLWGLIACHHYKEAKFINYSARSACTHYAVVLSSKLTTTEHNQLVSDEAEQRKRLPSTIRQLMGSESIQDAITKDSRVFQRLLNADGISVIKDDLVASGGDVPSRDLISEIHKKLIELYDEKGLYSIQSLKEIGIESTEGAGVLGVRIGEDLQVLFFRRESSHELKWGGDPNTPVLNDAEGNLTPRKSFEIYKQKTQGSSREWTDADLSLAGEFRASLASFIIERNSRLEELNAELEDRNSEIQQFAYSISHDLKSPLVTIGGYVRAVEEDIYDGEYDEARNSLSRIKQAAGRMGRLIDDLLTFSRIGRRGEKIGWLNMSEICETLQEEFSKKTAENGIELTFPEKAENIYGIESDIIRTLQNLIENAVKYMDPKQENPKIEVNTYVSKKYITYEVIDNGLGIDPIYHNKIFKLFERLDANKSGTGLGLATVHKVMEQLGGQIELESSAGNGATFRLHFPKPVRSV